MDTAQHSAIVNFIWSIADDELRDVYVRGKYRDVILPMTVIRRLDAVLEPTKPAVLKLKETLDAAKLTDEQQAPALCSAAGRGMKFYNASPFTLKSLLDQPKQLKANFEAYLDGFSANVLEIISKFNFRSQLTKLQRADVLGDIIEKFTDPRINLSPYVQKSPETGESMPGLTNHNMGTVFEELLRRFNEANNEEAGEHFTPREVVHLMTRLLVTPIADQLDDGIYYIYDCACGSGGMLTEAENILHQLADDQGKDIQTRLYGQEVSDETYAICKADLLIKGEDEENIYLGSTISDDHFGDKQFDFMIANPPYGKSWKSDQKSMGGKKDLSDPRFVIEHDGDPEYSMLPRSSDGQLLFLVNMLAKRNRKSVMGSRITTVHNGSSLFTGDAGSGESNIRRWLIENDWLEAIIGLPDNMFYNTGISTYIWVLSTNKPAARRGKVQLIDARQWFTKMRKSLGMKNRELSEADIDRILTTFRDFEPSEQSKIVDNRALGFWKVTVERPLRLRTQLTPERITAFNDACRAAKLTELPTAVAVTAKALGADPILDYNAVIKALKAAQKKANGRWSKTREKVFIEHFCEVDPKAEKVIAKKSKGVITYESDSNLRDTEQIPLDTEGGIDGYMAREVLPHVPDAWVDTDKTRIGYEIPFTRYFYKYEPPRPPEEIAAEIRELESGISALLAEVLA